MKTLKTPEELLPPKIIYLQWDGSADEGSNLTLQQRGEVTWCEDKINDRDVKYTRAPIQSHVEEMILQCIPGGSICDPQVVADNIRNYHLKFPSPEPTKESGFRTPEQWVSSIEHDHLYNEWRYDRNELANLIQRIQNELIQSIDPAKELEEIAKKWSDLFSCDSDSTREMIFKRMKLAILESTKDLRRQVEELKKYYIHHLPYCASNGHTERVCTCGLDNVLNQKG